jgi:serine/threonine-protein kinase HipA
MSVQGVQPKLSAVLRVKENRFEVVDRSGRFILKPCPPHWPEVPANEALTMTLAEHSGIEVPVHGLVEATDGSMVYFIRRFDRVGQGERLPLEDGAQLLGHTRDTKYDSSMEQVIGMIEEYCTFPVIEKRKLMQRVWFSFLTGNEDMHLKNWSLLSREGRVALSPAYDLLNSSIVLKNPQEETALPIRGRKRNLNRRDLLDYLAVERCGLPPDMMRSDLEALLLKAGTDWPTWINRSFLSEQKLEAYLNLVRERVARLQDHKA